MLLTQIWNDRSSERQIKNSEIWSKQKH